ncbi:hypothetical protein [Aliiroseovarius sp. S253]|uniref:hypothetical protein n=1 Tax=Aliiroseovarius sp. S253 TaxID=3415133 RepID=UPI003C7DFEBA
MTGSELFKHAYDMVRRNMGTAFRLSLVLFLASLAFQMVFSFGLMSYPNLMLSLGTIPFILLSYIPSIVSLVMGAWVAVAWHRYVLLEESSGGWIPPFHGVEVFRYILWVIALFVIYLVLALPIILVGAFSVTGIESGQNPSAGMIALFVVGFLATFLAVVIVLSRLSTSLVSRAVSQRLSLAGAWAATRGSSWPILMCALIMLAIMFAYMIIAAILFAVLGAGVMIIVLPFHLLFSWFVIFFQISFMTTLYGVYVEGRGLVA